MKRLLRIGISTFVLSFIPIISWFLLGLTVDASLVNIFSLTYPIQFICQLFVSIFATAANIKKEKEKNENAVLSGMVLGMVVGGVVLSFFLIFVDGYISFMKMDADIYRDYAIYSIVASFIRLVFSFILEKMYFEDKDKTAYKHSLAFNLLNIIVLIGVSLITKNSTIIIVSTLLVIAIYVVVLLCFQFKKFKLDFNILSNFKYESAEIMSCLFFFLMYLIGYSNAFQAGEEYIVAINFVALITDSQWDSSVAIATVAKLDIAKGRYNLKETIKNSSIFISIVVSSSLVLFFSLFSLYKVNLGIGLACLAVEVVTFALEPFRGGFEPYIQLEHSALKNTIIKTFCDGLRFVLSITLPLALCTQVAQIIAVFVSLGLMLFVLFRYYIIKKDGFLELKIKKVDDLSYNSEEN